MYMLRKRTDYYKDLAKGLPKRTRKMTYQKGTRKMYSQKGQVKCLLKRNKENDLSKKDPASRLIGVLETKRIKIHTL